MNRSRATCAEAHRGGSVDAVMRSARPGDLQPCVCAARVHGHRSTLGTRMPAADSRQGGSQGENTLLTISDASRQARRPAYGPLVRTSGSSSPVVRRRRLVREPVSLARRPRRLTCSAWGSAGRERWLSREARGRVVRRSTARGLACSSFLRRWGRGARKPLSRGFRAGLCVLRLRHVVLHAGSSGPCPRLAMRCAGPRARRSWKARTFPSPFSDFSWARIRHCPIPSAGRTR